MVTRRLIFIKKMKIEYNFSLILARSKIPFNSDN